MIRFLENCRYILGGDMDNIVEKLLEAQDMGFRQFHIKLLPTVDEGKVIGVRTPVLRKIAKEISKSDECVNFLNELPHNYYEENQLHGFIISDIKDFSRCITEIEKFLPYIDNWATCDQTSPKVFKKNRDLLLPYIDKWIQSNETYTVRFAIGMLMQHYLDEDFRPEYVKLVSSVKSEEYYVNMEIAWYMATALAKQWDETVIYLEEKKMDKWVHNKTIQKARESYRITAEQKKYLKTLKI